MLHDGAQYCAQIFFSFDIGSCVTVLGFVNILGTLNLHKTKWPTVFFTIYCHVQHVQPAPNTTLAGSGYMRLGFFGLKKFQVMSCMYVQPAPN